jgi:hypothetical protein
MGDLTVVAPARRCPSTDASSTRTKNACASVRPGVRSTPNENAMSRLVLRSSTVSESKDNPRAANCALKSSGTSVEPARLKATSIRISWWPASLVKRPPEIPPSSTLNETFPSAALTPLMRSTSSSTVGETSVSK